MAATATKPEAVPAPTFEDDDLVTVIRKNWGTPAIPKNKKDWMVLGGEAGGIEFNGGVARDVVYSTIKPVLKKPKIGIKVLPNDSTDADFLKATGVKPLPIREFAAMLDSYDLDLLKAELGEETLKKLAATLKKATS